MSEDRVREIQQRERAAELESPGEWYASGDSRECPPMVWDGRGDSIVSQLDQFGMPYMEPSVAAFVANAKQDIPHLLSEVSRLQEKLRAERKIPRFRESQHIERMVAAGCNVSFNDDLELVVVSERAEAAESRIQSLTEAQRWIPVSEKLPDTFEQVLVYLKPVPDGPDWYPRTNTVLAWQKRGIWFGTFTNPETFSLESGEFPDDLITHWRPLPAPPETHGRENK